MPRLLSETLSQAGCEDTTAVAVVAPVHGDLLDRDDRSRLDGSWSVAMSGAAYINAKPCRLELRHDTSTEQVQADHSTLGLLDGRVSQGMLLLSGPLDQPAGRKAPRCELQILTSSDKRTVILTGTFWNPTLPPRGSNSPEHHCCIVTKLSDATGAGSAASFGEPEPETVSETLSFAD